MTTGERIRILRMEKGLSQEGLADGLDVTRQAVSRWETDASLPDIDKLIGLCDLFGVSLDYLVRGKESHTGTPAEEAEPAAQTYSIPISRTTVAGILCIVLGISAAPLLIFAFSPIVSVNTLIFTLIPVALLLAGILLLLKRKPSLLWCCWSLLLTGALFYTAKTSRDLSDMIRGSLTKYPSLLYSNWDDYKPLMLVWVLFGGLIVGMMLWTVLRYRKTGLVHHRMRYFLVSGSLFLGSTVLLTLVARQIVRNISSIVIIPMWLYLLFWLAVLSLTYCLVWLLSPVRSTDHPQTP